MVSEFFFKDFFVFSSLITKNEQNPNTILKLFFEIQGWKTANFASRSTKLIQSTSDQKAQLLVSQQDLQSTSAQTEFLDFQDS